MGVTIHSDRSVEHSGLQNLLQTCVNFGAKYGKFNIADVLHKRKAVAAETCRMSFVVKTRITEALAESKADNTISLCTDMYTDDYRKKSYIDVHASWINRNFELNHAALAVTHFGTVSHTADNIHDALMVILKDYDLSMTDIPATTDHGSNIVAALRNNIRVDCLCHRLHTVLDTAWRETKLQEPEAAEYESAISELCRYAKQASGFQEQLPTSLKHGGDTRPWVSMFRRADSVEKSFDVLVPKLTEKGRLELIAKVSRSFNREILAITNSVKDVFESLEKANEPTLHLVVPSYYLLQKSFKPVFRDSKPMKTFRSNLLKYLDEKYWTSVVAFHWIACFLDPTFKNLHFIPQVGMLQLDNILVEVCLLS